MATRWTGEKLDTGASDGADMDSAVSYVQRTRDTLIATLPPVDDGSDFDTLQQQLLSRVHAGEASTVVIDASYVSTIDLHEFDRLKQLLRMIETMGAHCSLCGVQAAVAATLVTLNAQVDDIQAFSNLDTALDAAPHAVVPLESR